MTSSPTASARLDSGPAAATSSIPVPIDVSRKRVGSTGTGFAQPNGIPSNGSSTVPIGSRCANGSSVMRPSFSAVSSPSA